MSCTWPRWPPEDQLTRQALAVAGLAGRWAISGPPSALPSYLDAVSESVAHLAGRRFAVLTSSGSSAIVLALQALGIGPGCRVLMPATTWVGCATAILRAGATPVFLDSEETSPCVPTRPYAMAVGRVDAVLAIHTYASQVDVPAVREALPRVPVVEDCSHCHGAVSTSGRRLGSFGDLSIFSFQATKVLPAGEGGAVVTDDYDMAARLMALATDSRRPVMGAPLDALIRLEPAGLVHGANHAMSEFSAAVLWAQLLKLPELAARRANGLRLLAEQLDPGAGSLVFDKASAVSGGFYAVPFLPAQPWRGDVAQIVEEVWRVCGARLDRVYPPIPKSPLYRPGTVATYRHGEAALNPDPSYSAARFPNSTRWHHEGLVVPHAVLLADESALATLAETINRLSGRAPSRLSASRVRSGVDHREVCVVVVTSGRDTLTESLASVKQQTYAGPCSILLLCDNHDGSAERVPDLVASADLPPGIPVRTVTLTTDVRWDNDVFAWVARLRNVALGFVTAPLVAFLDDDNVWESDHLASLTQLLNDTRALAVHSWRRLLAPDGSPLVPDTFPWLRDPDAAAARFALLSGAGVFRPGSEIVRDRSTLPIGERDYGMVDMGEWLFDRRLFEIVPFEIGWTGEEIRDGVGEDDKLLRRLRELLIPVHCTERATLRYRLGGFTNGSPVTPGQARKTVCDLPRLKA